MARPKSRAGKPRASLRRRLGCGCLGLLFAVALGGLLLEGILRVFTGHFLGTPAEAADKYQLDDQRSYRLTPDWRGQQTIAGRTTSIRINSRGMRGPEMADQAVGELRILMFGDSYVFGHGVAEAETMAARLQVKLSSALGGAVQVGNCGVSGQGLRDMARNVEHHRKLDPDLIIACTYLGNDFTDDCRRYTGIVEGHLLLGPMGRLAHSSARFRRALRYHSVYLVEKLLLEHAPSLSIGRDLMLPNAEENAAYRLFPPGSQHLGCLFFDRRRDDALVAKILATSRESYASIHQTAADVPVLYVLIPGRWHVHEPSWRQAILDMNLDPGQHEFGKARRRIATLLQDLGPCHDLSDAIMARPRPTSLWFKTDNHFTPEACDLAAEWLVPVVRQILGR